MQQVAGDGAWLGPMALETNESEYNLYRYAENNPVTQTDPSGLWTGTQCIAACDAIFKKNRDRQQCYKICKAVNDPNCPNLATLCGHLGRGHGATTYEQKICNQLWQNLCRPFDCTRGQGLLVPRSAWCARRQEDCIANCNFQYDNSTIGYTNCEKNCNDRLNQCLCDKNTPYQF